MNVMPKLVLDCRSREAFASAHHNLSAHIPAHALFERMHELPRSDQKLCVIHSEHERELCEAFFKEKNYHQVEYQQWCDDYQQKLLNEGYLSCASELSEKPLPPVRLWQSAAFIQDFVEKQQAKFAIKPGQGLDIACGSGRDAVYLGLNGWKMTGIDYNQGSLERFEDLAKRHNIIVSSHKLDLEQVDEHQQYQPILRQQFKAEQFDLINVLRYLHRPQWPEIAELIKPGGVILYQTFMQGCEKISRPKNPRFLLKPNELADFFSQHGFDILRNDIEHLADGRPVSAFIARKPNN